MDDKQSTEQKLQQMYANEWPPGRTVIVGMIALVIALLIIVSIAELAAGASNSFGHTSDSWNWDGSKGDNAH